MVLQYVRRLDSAVQFYGEGLGCPVSVLSEKHAQVAVADGGLTLALEQTDCEALLTTGYSPHLNFSVSGLDELLPRLLSMGATLDGPVHHRLSGQAAAVRSADGQMIRLIEVSKE